MIPCRCTVGVLHVQPELEVVAPAGGQTSAKLVLHVMLMATMAYHM